MPYCELERLATAVIWLVIVQRLVLRKPLTPDAIEEDARRILADFLDQ